MTAAKAATTKARLVELSAELDFLDLCELLLLYAAKTQMVITWKHPRVTVAIKQLRPPKKAKP